MKEKIQEWVTKHPANNERWVKYVKKKKFAWGLRKKATCAERVLWKNIRANKLGARFSRQRVLCGYIVDFYCKKLDLIVEVDGGYHFTSEQKVLDEIREKALRKKGYSMLRFTNEEVFKEIDKVKQRICSVILPPEFGTYEI